MALQTCGKKEKGPIFIPSPLTSSIHKMLILHQLTLRHFEFYVLLTKKYFLVQLKIYGPLTLWFTICKNSHIGGIMLMGFCSLANFYSLPLCLPMGCRGRGGGTKVVGSIQICIPKSLRQMISLIWIYFCLYKNILSFFHLCCKKAKSSELWKTLKDYTQNTSLHGWAYWFDSGE